MPCEISIRDDSRTHAGHAQAGEQTHLSLHVVSRRFEGLSLRQRHQLVYAAAAPLLQGSLHALKLVTQTPRESTLRQPET
jgi:BolA family transcriptional regulator, general stress-responsive regulator